MENHVFVNHVLATQHMCSSLANTNGFKHYKPKTLTKIIHFPSTTKNNTVNHKKKPNFTSTTNGNQTLNTKTFYISTTTKNRTSKRLHFLSKST